MNTSFNRVMACVALALILSVGAFAQATTSSTTLSLAVAKNDLVINVASATGITGPNSLNAPTTYLFVDREEMPVLGVSGTQITVQRGGDSTPIATHASGATVWFGAPNYFLRGDPSGSCTASALPALPMIATDSGIGWTCPSSGPNSGLWARQFIPTGYNLTDGAFMVPPGACYDVESGHAGALVHQGVVNGTVVIQGATTSSASSDTITFVCTIMPPYRTSATKGIALTDATFIYGNQTTNLGTQAATLASGTFNGSTVFQKLVAPVAGAGETASSATLVRADSGTMAITPVAASFNGTAVTAGQFYTAKFAPASPIQLSDLTPLIFTVKLVVTDSAATQINSPGVLVHYIESPL
jgi:hypothetical protein